MEKKNYLSLLTDFCVRGMNGKWGLKENDFVEQDFKRVVNPFG